MGCFDSTCCLTGLPLHHNDPVRAAIIVKNDSQFYGYAASQWQFWTPPVASVYDDYGNIEFDDVPDDEMEVLSLFLNLMRPGLELCENYPDKELQATPKSEWTLPTLWNGMWNGRDLVFDPGREQRNAHKDWVTRGKPEGEKEPSCLYGRRTDRYPVFSEGKPDILARWMCHQWAWDALVAIHPTIEGERFQSEVKRFMHSYKMVEECIDNKYGPNTNRFENQEAWDDWYELASRDCTSIVGEQGAFVHDLRLIILNMHFFGPELHNEFVRISDKVKKMIVDTVVAVNNLFFIRKIISPMTTCGEQYESFEHLPAWHSLVAKKCEEAASERREGW